MISKQRAMGNHDLLSNPNSCPLHVSSLIAMLQVTAKKELNENANYSERTKLLWLQVTG
jgi:hypothetical protein